MLNKKFVGPESSNSKSSRVDSESELDLTTKPHDEHHLRGDFVISEKVQQERQREDVHRSAKKNQDLQTEWRQRQQAETLTEKWHLLWREKGHLRCTK